ncbi:lysosome membrane protein 2-like [Littorina saxatilis]|uniref:Uncharacterized protein n=1 Tax=Littorina saxatilis TaxID=31220 RepID=A0AAN9G6E4_9CAEN
MYCSKGRCCKWTCGIVGLVALVTGCVLIQVFDNLIHEKVKDELPLKNGSVSYKNWLSPPAPIYFQIYVQHVANAEEVVQLGAKPVLVQKGPYTYREKRQKVNITYTADNTITYRENQFYFFDRSRSVGPENDNFTTVNLPMITIANMVKYQFGIIQEMVNTILEFTDEHVFIDLTVAELMWGYEDSLLKDVKNELAKLGITLPIDDKFGMFLNKNGSNDGLYRITSGLGGTVDHFAEILSWDGNRSLNFWNSDVANSLNGSDGTMYPPFIDTSRSYYLFSSDLCRSLEIVHTKDYTLKGIDLRRFIVPPRTFANVSTNPYNKGFCTPESNCLPSGVLNASVCKQGAPVILSLPHFLDGDPAIQNRVIGMNPNREKHQSVIDIEPMTGVVMNAAKRVQLNAYLTKIPHIKDTTNIHPYIILPILWLDESAKIDDKSASDFKSEVLMPLKIADAVQYGLIALGVFLLTCFFICFAKGAFCKTKDREMQSMGETTPILPSA